MTKFIFLILIFTINSYPQVPYLNGNYNFLIDSIRSPLVKAGIPLITDLDKDGNKEIIIATANNTDAALHVLKSDMTEYPGFPKYFTEGILDFASGDVDGDGYLDIALKFQNSFTVIDRFGNNLPGFPVTYTNGSSGVFAMISLYDLDNNGRLEIITSSLNELCVFNYNGQVRNGWPKRIAGVTNFAPAIGDIDGDGFAEIINTSFRPMNNPPYVDSGAVSIFRENGALYSNAWPSYFDSNYVTWDGSPSLYIDRNNINNSFFLLPTGVIISQNHERNRITKYNFNGAILARKYIVTIDYVGTLILGDVDNDGQIDIAFGTQQSEYLTLMSNNLVAMSGWPQTGSSGFYKTLVLGKISNSSNINIISTSLRGSFRYNALFNYEFNGAPVQNFPLDAIGFNKGISMADLNNDGSVELITSAQVYGSSTYLHIFTFPGIVYSPASDPWPQFGHDRYRTNQYGFIPPDEPIGILPISSEIPLNYNLHQNYPNPFNPVTKIKFDIPKYDKLDTRFVQIIIYDILGREINKIVNESLRPGTYEVQYNSTSLASGVYFYSLITNGYSATKKMVILK